MGHPVETMTAGLAADTQGELAEVLAEVMRAGQVPVDSHFFDDLGADSLLMAKFCARLRKRADLPSVSMQDVYRHPTIRSLAAAFASPVPVPAPAEWHAPASSSAVRPEVAASTRTGQYIMCGTLQLLFFLGYAWVAALRRRLGLPVDLGRLRPGRYLPALGPVRRGGVPGAVPLPILAKWVLIGRWKPQQIRIWSLGYVRFWIVRTLVRSNPLALLAVGSPLYVLYLRALGAKVGRGTVIFSKHVPVCTDLLTIGPEHRHPQGRLLDLLPGASACRLLRVVSANAPVPSSIRCRASRKPASSSLSISRFRRTDSNLSVVLSFFQLSRIRRSRSRAARRDVLPWKCRPR